MAFQIATKGCVMQTARITLEDVTRALQENNMGKALYLCGETD
jgi:ABC-type branched-subunit amino acid transport system ATPase component